MQDFLRQAEARMQARKQRRPSQPPPGQPRALAALDQSGSDGTQQPLHSAIRNSDNEDADAVWNKVGRGYPAASAVDAVRRSHGDAATVTQSMETRQGFSAFGQTDWSLDSQVAFAKDLFCGSATNLVYADMGRISTGRRWGLGQIPARAAGAPILTASTSSGSSVSSRSRVGPSPWPSARTTAPSTMPQRRSAG
jgi:hypothetical protein